MPLWTYPSRWLALSVVVSGCAARVEQAAGSGPIDDAAGVDAADAADAADGDSEPCGDAGPCDGMCCALPARTYTVDEGRGCLSGELRVAVSYCASSCGGLSMELCLTRSGPAGTEVMILASTPLGSIEGWDRCDDALTLPPVCG